MYDKVIQVDPLKLFEIITIFHNIYVKIILQMLCDNNKKNNNYLN